MLKLVLPLLCFCLACLGADLFPPETDQRLARDIYKQMVESKSGFSTGATTPISEAIAARLKKEGFPASDIFVGGAIPSKANVVVRYRGTGARKPILLLAHTDVVEAKREDWTTDPFTLIEKDGYFYGRGTADDKAQASIWIANLIRYKREGFKPDRDLIVALTADEEGGGPYNGVDWLLKNKRELIDADFALNEGGGGVLVNGKRLSNNIVLSEKMYADFQLEVRNKGGHSARPVPDNAIYQLAGALTRLSTFTFPFRVNEVARAYFQQMAKIESGPLASDFAKIAEGSQDAMRRVAAASPAMAAMMRTTCVATMLEGGHAVNALPQLAAANVNCRILPEDSVDNVLQTLRKIVADDQVMVKIKTDEGASPSSPMRADIMKAFNHSTDVMWPGVVTLPSMSAGATDGRYLRATGIPVYSLSGIFNERDDVRAHGRDERLPVRSFFEGQTFMYEFVKSLAKTPE
jgi:acetylornithine deacetylase/succinyl-diaminopimelate desuccinylase-like protein